MKLLLIVVDDKCTSTLVWREGAVTYAGGFHIKRIGFWLYYPRGNLTIEIVGDAIDAVCQIHSDLLGSSWNPLDTDHTFYLMISLGGRK